MTPAATLTGTVRFASALVLTKHEVFGACDALAEAEAHLLRHGHPQSAARLSMLFELLEGRLVLDPSDELVI